MIVTPRQAIVSAVLFCFHGINLFKNLVSRELLRILENFHFSISISKHFDFTFHFSKKSESILISLCTSRKRVKAFFFHFALLEKEWKLFIFTFHFSNFKNPLSLVPGANLSERSWKMVTSAPGLPFTPMHQIKTCFSLSAQYNSNDYVKTKG